MSTTTNVPQVKLNIMTQQQYNAATKNPTELYMVTDAQVSYNDLADLNTYINIENFLWSVKQEPIVNPDNKTKIISHGFDLKTSFRKM